MSQDGHLKVEVNPPYALRDVAIADIDLESRETTGKLLLAIGGATSDQEQVGQIDGLGKRS